MITPPAKFCSVPCKAIPMARPMAPSSAINDVALMPTTSIAIITIIAFSSTSTRLPRNVFSDPSAPRLSNALIMIRFSIFASFMPTHSITIATSNFGTNCTVSSVRALTPSWTIVFSPVITSLMSVRFIFLRLSVTVRWILSAAFAVCANSSLGMAPVGFAAAAASKAGVLSSKRNISIQIWDCKNTKNSRHRKIFLLHPRHRSI